MQNILVLYSETLEIFLLTEPNRIKHDFAGSGLFQYFDFFSSSIEPNSVLLHLNDLTWCL